MKGELPACVSPAQQASLDYLHGEARSFLARFGDSPMPVFDWEKLMSLKKVGYSGELALKGVNLTWERMEPALPPRGLSGSVDAVQLSGESLRP